MFKFYVDKTVENKGPFFNNIIKPKAYPNLTKWQAEPYTERWRQFSVNYPFSEPVMLFEYMQYVGIDYELTSAEDADFYPIALSFFDFIVAFSFLSSVLFRVSDLFITIILGAFEFFIAS